MQWLDNLIQCGCMVKDDKRGFMVGQQRSSSSPSIITTEPRAPTPAAVKSTTFRAARHVRSDDMSPTSSAKKPVPPIYTGSPKQRGPYAPEPDFYVVLNVNHPPEAPKVLPLPLVHTKPY